MMMMTGPQASFRPPARASGLVDHDIVVLAVSWNPVPPAGVSGRRPIGGRTFVDGILDAHDPFLVPPTADCSRNTQFTQLGKNH